jgi:hypothetical protein
MLHIRAVGIVACIAFLLGERNMLDFGFQSLFGFPVAGIT